MSSEYFTRTSLHLVRLKIIEWIKCLEIYVKFRETGRNFLSNPSFNFRSPTFFFSMYLTKPATETVLYSFWSWDLFSFRFSWSFYFLSTFRFPLSRLTRLQLLILIIHNIYNTIININFINILLIIKYYFLILFFWLILSTCQLYLLMLLDLCRGER